MRTLLAFAPALALAGFVFLVFAWQSLRARVQQRRFLQIDIDALADDLLVDRAIAQKEMAAINEDRAWRYSDPIEQEKWRRVRDGIRLRQGLREIK